MTDQDPDALLDAMADGVYAVDLDRRITYWNPAATTISGYSRETAIGRWCGDGLLNHVDEDGKPMCGVNCPLLGTMRDGEPRMARIYLHHEDGHVAPVRITAAPLRGPDGTIVGAVETFTDDSQHVALRQELKDAEHLALIDPLTGLGNRRSFDASIERRFGSWTRHGHAFSVIAVDVDHFKSINDTFGHDAGDAILRVVARSLMAAARAGDEVFRPGGDEFVVLTGPTTVEELSVLATRLRLVVAASRHALDVPTGVTVSIGSAIVRDGDDHMSVQTRADGRLLEAKQVGRDASISEPVPVLPGPATGEVVTRSRIRT
jgi:diguanylate cyclase (GGDEF)-like protein/PAS domain S-box-containing protein